MPSHNSNGKSPGGFEELNYDEEFYFQWHITNECNLRCRHCYHESYLKEDIDIIRLTGIADQLCNALDKWKKKGSFSITGGEPLMNSEILFQLFHYFYTMDFKTNNRRGFLKKTCMQQLLPGGLKKSFNFVSW